MCFEERKSLQLSPKMETQNGYRCKHNVSNIDVQRKSFAKTLKNKLKNVLPLTFLLNLMKPT